MFLKARWILVLTLLTLTPFLTQDVSAGPNENAKILIHLAPTTTKNACVPVGGIPTCEEIVTAGDLYPNTYFAYVMVSDADSAAGISGIQLGIQYNGTTGVGADIYNWTNCATLEFPSEGWPSAGTGSMITWDSTVNCQRGPSSGLTSGVVAIAGYFYLAAYGQDTLAVCPRPADLAAKVSSCNALEDTVETLDLGYCVFSEEATTPGFSPCGSQSGLRAGNEGDEAEYASGFDPLTEKPEWPVTFTIGPFGAALVHDMLFLEGDEISLDYDPGSQSLALNGITIQSFNPRRNERPLSSREQWMATLRERFISQEDGSEDDRLASALELMDQSILDQTFTPVIVGASIKLRFRNDKFPITLSLRTSSPQVTTADQRALSQAMFVRVWLSQPTLPFVWVVKDFTSLSIMKGDALETIPLLKAAQERSLSVAERDRLSKVHIDPDVAQRSRRLRK